MLDQKPGILSRALTHASNACALALAALASLSAGGCAVWLYDDPYAPPPPPEPVYVVPEPAYYYTPDVYYYAPGAVILGQSPDETDASAKTAGADDRKANSAAAKSAAESARVVRGQDDPEAFPTLDDSFPTLDAGLGSDYEAPPESTGSSDFVRNGTNVPEPSGQYETIDYNDEDFRPEPKRESLAEREKAEEKIEKNFDEWLREKKAKRREENKKTKRYLQPIPEADPEIFDRQAKADKSEGDDDIIQTVTLDGIESLLENEETKRDLYDWEKEEPTPIDWSKYAMSLDNIRAWFGMGPNERAALEYMRQACNKQKEYTKTRDKKCLKEAATLYEKAAERWPGPALRPDYAKKHPYDAPKSGTLIEEDGLFFAGECWFFYRDFNRALSCYKALVSTYSSSIYKNVAMKRLFYIGCFWVECSEEASTPSVNVKDKDKPVFSTFHGAKKAFETIFYNDASDNGLAPDALFALANAYMRRGVHQGDGSFDSAAQYYKQLYEFYPASKHAEDACRLAMIALHKSYQGVYYDDAPLNEARQLAETILKSGRGNMDVIYEELDNIKDEQAHRLYALGAYYEKRGSYASARSYYNRLVKEHPNSDYAVEGARRYQQIESKPPEADQLAWVRPVMPFLPKPNKEFFEEKPHEDLSRIARRDDSLNRIGKDVGETKETKVAEAPSDTKRY